MNIARNLLVLLTCYVISGCSTVGYLNDTLQLDRLADTNLINANKQAANSLTTENTANLTKDKNIISSTFVNLDNLEQTTPMGRLLSEQISTELTKLGYKMVELRLRQDEILIEEHAGEFLLSRDTEKLMKEYDTQAFLVGTYTVASDIMYVTTRLINPNDNSIINAHNYSVSLGPNALTLINRELPEHVSIETNDKPWHEQEVIEDDDIVAF